MDSDRIRGDRHAGAHEPASCCAHGAETAKAISQTQDVGSCHGLDRRQHQNRVDRMYLGSQIGRNHAGWDALLATMVHEYCHGDPDMRDHLHGPDFYENFHATVTSASYKGWEMVDEAFRTYALEREKRKLSINEAMAEVLDRTDRSQSDHGGTSMPFGPGASPSSAQVNAKPVALATS